MIMLCAEIKEVKVQDQNGKRSKQFVYVLVLDTAMPQNSSMTAAKLEIMSTIRFKDIDPGEHYSFSRFPFISSQVTKGKKVNEKTS
jgi:hypothetical protein